MSTKRIWMMSVVLGLLVALFAYLTILKKDNVSSAAEVKVNKQITALRENKQKEQKTKVPKRVYKNPLEQVSKGKRALSIKVNLEQGVSGYIAPDSKVDVIAYESSKDTKTGKESRSAVLVLENVKVLGSGKSSNTKEEVLNYETVTLEVTPDQGVVLSLAAKDKDGFYLMLRNTADAGTGKAGIKQTREVINGGGN